MRVYIINVSVTINIIDDISYCGYFMGYVANTQFVLYWEKDQTLVIHIAHHVFLMNITIVSP